MKTIRTLLLVVAALAVLAVPATASAANWQKDGKELGLHWSSGGAPMESGEGSLALEGTLSWQSAGLGSISCPVSGNATLTPGNTGQLSNVTVTAAGCKMSGAIALECKSDTITSVQVTEQPLPITAKEVGGQRVIEVSSHSIVYQFNGGKCEKEVGAIIVAGSQIATPNNSTAISSLAFSGKMSAYATKLGSLGNVNGTSSLNVSPEGKYGISNEWHVAVQGNLNWDDPVLGGVHCSLAGTFVLEPGNKGRFTSISSPSGCTSWGIYGVCTGWSGNSPTLVNESTHIAIQGIELTGYGGKSCNLAISGNLTATPNKTSSISSVSLSGTLGGRAWTGGLNWTPAGVYGL
jgi:hypothetical protein